jgi:hypothetical protein
MFRRAAAVPGPASRCRCRCGCGSPRAHLKRYVRRAARNGPVVRSARPPLPLQAVDHPERPSELAGVDRQPQGRRRRGPVADAACFCPRHDYSRLSRRGIFFSTRRRVGPASISFFSSSSDRATAAASWLLLINCLPTLSFDGVGWRRIFGWRTTEEHHHCIAERVQIASFLRTVVAQFRSRTDASALLAGSR